MISSLEWGKDFYIIADKSVEMKDEMTILADKSVIVAG